MLAKSLWIQPKSNQVIAAGRGPYTHFSNNNAAN